ncbi:MAG: hypothetical protein ABR985_15985 [Methanotrichaceae archaeon]|jgi:hypothetical protein
MASCTPFKLVELRLRSRSRQRAGKNAAQKARLDQVHTQVLSKEVGQKILPPYPPRELMGVTSWGTFKEYSKSFLAFVFVDPGAHLALAKWLVEGAVIFTVLKN